VAPMACGVSDADEYGFVFGGGFSECVGSPLIPIDGVVCVLEEVGAGGVDETIRH
jgi:hypothetical protein